MSGLTATEYTDCGNVNNRYYAVTAVNENGESAPSNEDRASESCGSAAALTLPVLNAAALTESGGEPVITKYYFAGGKRVAMDREGVVQWLVGDHLGTTSQVLNANGTVHSEARHYPYGEERWSWPQEGTFPTDYRFTGQRSDSYIKLTVMGARWYDGQLGRWISPDTIIPDPANPQSFNRLSYVYNNPLRFVDPTGMFTEEELVEWGAYTLEEIEALRGSAWYAILMEAQLGDSVYFGNGIDYYTGPMGMGTFYLYEDTLYIGGDVSLWNQDRGGYDSHKVWDSAQQWGELFNAVSHEPDSYGLIPAPPDPDYSAYNFSFGGFVGISFTVTRDKYGGWYFAAGPAFGESVLGPSFNVSQGYLLVYEDPNEQTMRDFCTGWALNVNGGSLVGMGYTDSLGPGGPGAVEFGWYTPQLGFSFQHAWPLPIPK